MAGVKGKSGRKDMPPGPGRPIKADKKIMVSMKLPPSIIDMLDSLVESTGKSRAVLVEDALTKTYLPK